MRILFAANPMLGHLLPVIPVATAMQERGHDVLVATEPGAGSLVESYGLGCSSVGRDLTIEDMFAVLPDIFDVSAADQDAYARPRIFVELRAHNVIADLVDLVTRWRPDLIVRESAEFASWAVAERFSIPHIAVNAGADNSALRWNEVAGPWFDELGRRIGLVDLQAGSLYRHGVLSFEPDGYFDWSDTPGAVVHRPAPAVRSTPTSERTANGAEPMPSALDRFDERSLIYVTLGTEFYNGDLMRSIISGLGTGEWNLAVTTGPQGDPDEVDPKLPHVVVSRWMDQDPLLGRAAAVVCHAGAGTTIGSIVHGVPLVCLPQGADQFHHAQRVEELGLGRVLGTDQRSAEDIRSAVVDVLTDPRYRIAVSERAAATALLPDVVAAAELLEQLVEEPSRDRM